jgi:hypothetical protein
MLASLVARRALLASRLAQTAPTQLGRPVRSLTRGLCAKATPAEESTLGHIVNQVKNEFATATSSQAKFFGFFGACCNWFLGLSAVYDASCKGPEVISLKMTGVMLCYSTLFGRWAGWAVTPRNYVLAASHIFNVVAQCNQLRRALLYKVENDPSAANEISELGMKAAAGLSVVGVAVMARNQIKAIVAPLGPAWLASEGGPFTIHPWPPMTKLMISGASLLELDRPTHLISFSQYAALTLTGAIFSRYGLVVTPINYPLTGVNVLLFLSSAWHLGRKIKADFM